MRRITIIVISSLVILLSFAAAAQAAPKVVLNGQTLSFDVPPTIENGRILVPLRVIFEDLGAGLVWDDTAQTATATMGNTTVTIKIMSSTAQVNDQTITLDAPPQIVDGRILVPLRFVSESLGASVSWDGDTQTVSITAAQQAPKQMLTQQDATDLAADPAAYAGYPINVTGKVFSIVQSGQFQIWLDPANSKGNAIVSYDGPVNVKVNDFIFIAGTVQGEVKSTNTIGNPISMVNINATTINEVSPLDVLAPSIKTIQPNKSTTQSGLTITVSKVEFASQETRIYVTIDNQSGSEASIYAYSTKVVQGNKQYDAQSRLDQTIYPQIQTDLLAGVQTSGILVFGPLDTSAGALTLHIEGSFSDYTLTFSPVDLQITW